MIGFMSCLDLWDWLYRDYFFDISVDILVWQRSNGKNNVVKRTELKLEAINDFYKFDKFSSPFSSFEDNLSKILS